MFTNELCFFLRPSLVLRKWGWGYHRSITIKRPIGNAFDGRDVTVFDGRYRQYVRP